MVNMANIICKTAGIAGMSAVVYDSYAHAKHHAHVAEEELSADVYQKAFDAKRTTETQSHLTGEMQKKIMDIRMKNPVISVFGKTKGFIEGFLLGLGDNIVPVICSSLALATKGFTQKLGAWGLAGYALVKVIHEGFGVGKSTAVKD